MTQQKSDVSGQVEYLGRWVDKKHFRAFVFNKEEQRLANNYEEFEKLIASGLWFVTKEDAIKIIKSDKIVDINAEKTQKMKVVSSKLEK